MADGAGGGAGPLPVLDGSLLTSEVGGGDALWVSTSSCSEGLNEDFTRLLVVTAERSLSPGGAQVGGPTTLLVLRQERESVLVDRSWGAGLGRDLQTAGKQASPVPRSPHVKDGAEQKRC